MKFSIGYGAVKKFLFSFILAFLITLVLTGLLAIIFSLSHPSDTTLNFICHSISFLSSFIVAFLCAGSIGKNGLFTGAVSSCLYMAILTMCGIAFLGNPFDLQSFIKVIGISSLCGALGGIVGINLKKAS